MSDDRSDRHLVIGAGFAGLGVAAAMKRYGIRFDMVDASDDIGGNWYHGVYDTAHIISSRKTTQYADFPMPDDYPDFPSAGQMLAYLRAFARHYGLYEHVELNTFVEKVTPLDGDRWSVKIRDSNERIYGGVVIANGHHWDRRFPEYPGKFAGQIIHSKDYKDAEILRGQRVLTIGGGNSACDVAVEAARFGKRSVISLRRGYWFMPKTFFGVPSVEFIKPWLPVPAQRIFIKAMIRVVVGKYTDYGLQEPDHRIFDHHPTINSQLLHCLKHGTITPKPDVKRFDGRTVEFVDGTCEDFDLVVCATGFNVQLPMLDASVLQWKDGFPQLVEGVFPPNHKNLYVFGLGQPRYGAGPLITAGANLLCTMIHTQTQLQNPVGKVLQRLGRKPPTTWLRDPMQVLRGVKRGQRMARRLPLIERMMMR